MMQKDKFTIGFYWGDDQKTIKEASRWVIDLITYINESSVKEFNELYFSSSLSKLVLTNERKNENYLILANDILTTKLATIKKYHKGVVPSVEFHEPVGFVFTLISSLEGSDRFVIRFSIGKYSGGTNVITVDYPRNFAMSFEWAHTFFNLMNLKINPLYSFIASDKIRNSMEQNLPEFFFGWMNYFNQSIRLPSIPSDCFFEKTLHGQLLITTKDIFDAVNNSEHYKKAKQIVDFFRAHNIIRP